MSNLNVASFSLKYLSFLLSLQAWKEAFLYWKGFCIEGFLRTCFSLDQQLQISQPFYMGSTDNFCGPLWTCSDRFMSFLWQKITELCAVLQVGSQQRWAEQENHLPQPAVQAAFGAAHIRMGFLGHKCVSLDQSTGISEKGHGIEVSKQESAFSMDKLLYVEVRAGTTRQAPILWLWS